MSFEIKKSADGSTWSTIKTDHVYMSAYKEAQALSRSSDDFHGVFRVWSEDEAKEKGEPESLLVTFRRAMFHYFRPAPKKQSPQGSPAGL